MDKISYAVKLGPSLVTMVREFCEEHGLKQGYFVEKALKEQLAREEHLEDLKDLKALKSQEIDAIDFKEYLQKRKR